MVKATVKVEYNQQSKLVTANTKIELEADVEDDNALEGLKNNALSKAKELFDEAFVYAKKKSMEM